MIKFPQAITRIVVLCACLLISLSALYASVRTATAAPDLTDSVWKWGEEEAGFVLTFKQGKPQTNGVVAILKGWGDGPLELRGEFAESDSAPRLHITGSHEGEAIALDLEFNAGDHEQQPFLYGEFAIGSRVFPVSAGCGNQCPDVSAKKAGEPEADRAASNGTEFIGEWQDDSEAIGFKEYWSVSFLNGKWSVSGRFVKDKEVVGSFHAEEISFDTKKGVLYFRQAFDQKPDERWLDSNDIEVTVQNDTLKFKVRGAEGTLTRASRQ